MGLVLIALAVSTALPATAKAPNARNVYGIQTLLRTDTMEKTEQQLTWAKTLIGPGGHVTQPFSPLDRSTAGPTPEAIAFVEHAYSLNLNPIIRLQGEFANGTACDPNLFEGWLKPAADSPDSAAPEYTEEAAGYARFVAGLPRANDRMLYIQIWNEPNLHYMWGRSASPTEYARFLVDVSAAIRSIGDDRIQILNAGLAPEGDVDNLRFIQEAIAADPRFASSFDYWASHPYPHNQPPENNLHSRTARAGSRYTIDAYLLELDVLKTNGVDTDALRVVLTETGYRLDEAWYPEYPPITEVNRADYMNKAFEEYWSKWPEVLAVTPFQLVDSSGSWGDYEWVWTSSDSDANGFPTQPHLQYARLLKGVGLVAGAVTDETGKPLKDVLLETSANGHRSVTLRDGTYIMIAYPGSYEISAQKRGYLPAAAREVMVTPGGTRQVDLALVANFVREVRNPSVETGDLSEWTPWGATDGVQQGKWYSGVEAYDGEYFLGTASNCVEKDGGFYQSVAATPGRTVAVSAWLLTYKQGSFHMASRIGVDPHGGTDPDSGDIVWSDWKRTGGSWKNTTVRATAQSDRVTIFLHHDQNLLNLWNINGFDRIEITELD